MGHYKKDTIRYDGIDEAFGGDYDYDEISTKNQMYFTLAENWSAGVRLDGSFVDGDAPFWALPYIELRGIPALRYQGEDVITSEVQANWEFHPRWTVLGFIGAGRATNTGLSDAETQMAGGFGFRYMALRRLGMNMGWILPRARRTRWFTSILVPRSISPEYRSAPCPERGLTSGGISFADAHTLV